MMRSRHGVDSAAGARDNAVVRSHATRWILLLVVLVAGGWYFGFRSKDGDRELPVYVTGAERMAAGDEIYRKGEDAKVFTYPPFAAVPFVPFVVVPAKWQPAAWFAVNFALLLLVLRFLHRWASSAWPDAGPQRLVAAWIWVGLLAGRHVSSVFENQSHDLFICAFAAAGAWSLGRRGQTGSIGAGIAVGAGAAFKATPLLFLELFVVARSWAAIGASIASVVLLSLLPDWIFPRDDGASWVVRWFDVFLRGMEVGGAASTEGAWLSHSFLNQGLAGTLARLFSPTDQTSVFVHPDAMVAHLPPLALKTLQRVAQVGVLVVIAIGALRLRAAQRAADPDSAWRRAALGACGLVVCGMVLLSPQSSKQHFCVLLLPAMFCADRLLRSRRDVLLFGLLLASALLASATSKGVLGKQVGNLVLAWGSVTWSTVLLMLATLRAMQPERAEDS